MEVCHSKEGKKRKFSNFSNSQEWFILPGNFSNLKYEGIQAYIWGPELWIIRRFIHLDKQTGWNDLLKSSPDGDFDTFFLTLKVEASDKGILSPSPSSHPAEICCHQLILFPGQSPTKHHQTPAEQGKHWGCGKNGAVCSLCSHVVTDLWTVGSQRVAFCSNSWRKVLTSILENNRHREVQ